MIPAEHAGEGATMKRGITEARRPRAEALTAVWAPDAANDALWDLVRARTPMIRWSAQSAGYRMQFGAVELQ